MKIETQLTFKDNLRANYYFTYSRPTMIFFCILGIYFVYLFISGTGEGFDTNETGVILGLMVILYIILAPLLIYIQTKKHYNSNKNLHKPITYEFTYEGIELNSDDLHSNFPWENVHKVKESKNLFYIYQSKVLANIVPKRFFSPQEMLEFRELVKRKGVKSKLRKG